MVFSDIVFIFMFLPITLCCYFLSSIRWRNGVLVLASLIFYAWGEPIYVLIMVFSTVLDYSVGLGMDKFRTNIFVRKCFLCISLVCNIGMLGVFKYSNFLIENINSIFDLSINAISIALPIGISFYTFQTMSYTIDVYRGKICCQKKFIDFAMYVTMFPQLVAGPIVAYSFIEKNITNRMVSRKDIEYGIDRLIEGLAKKVLIANNIGLVWNIYCVEQTELSVVTAWLGIISFGLQIYYDFSGYSDIAIGLGYILGFEFPENFNYPYTAKSVTGFWRRWHMTLGNWFKEYVYIPLGGNRVSSKRWTVNILIVWGCTGVWHGASWNFLLWGLIFACLMIFEKKIKFEERIKKKKVLPRIYMFIVLGITWVFFAIDDISKGCLYLNNMFGFNGNAFIDREAMYILNSWIGIYIIAFIFMTPVGKSIKNRLGGWYFIIQIIMFILSIAYLVDATFNPFLYFRF